MKTNKISLFFVSVLAIVMFVAAYTVNVKEWKQGYSVSTAVTVDSNSSNMSYSGWFESPPIDPQSGSTISLWYDFESDSTIGKDTVTIIVEGRHYIDGVSIIKNVDTLSKIANTSASTTTKTSATTTATTLSLSSYAPEYRFKIKEDDATGIAKTNTVYIGIFAVRKY